MAITLGETLWKLPDVINWNREKGDVISFNYAGRQEAIEDLKETLQDDEYVDNIQVTGGATWKLSYSRTALEQSNQQNDDNNAVANSVWEIIPEQIDTNIKACPDFKGLKDYFAIIDLAIENGNMDDNGNFDIVGYCNDQQPAKTIAQYWDEKYPNTKAGIYYQMKAHGVESFPLFRWVIRQTVTINKNSLITVHGEGFDNKPVVVESSEIPLPSTVNFTVPSDYQWLVIPPQVTKQGNKKTIVYEWRGAKTYSPTLYTGGNKEIWEA